MISPLELRRIFTEWRTRLQRVQAILSPPVWDESEWRRFGRALLALLQQHGATWSAEQQTYWDLRWHLRDGGELICQAEASGATKVSLVVAQTGGWVQEAESYTWFWMEIGPDGDLLREPYWVEGTWREALMTLLVPYQYQAGYFLAGAAPTPPSLMLAHAASSSEGSEPHASPAAG